MVRNEHERRIAAPEDRVGALLDTLASDHDRLWPVDRWPALRLDAPLGVGARGGHGPIRYSVEEYQPGLRVTFRFDAAMGGGYHRFEVRSESGQAVLAHVLETEPRGRLILLWPLALRWLHDALIEDALDRAEASLGVGPEEAARWSPYVRALRLAVGRRRAVHAVEVPASALALSGLRKPDFADAFAVRLPPGASLDARDWHEALVAAGTPSWVAALVGLRAVVARAMRLRTAGAMRDSGPFTVIAAAPDVVVAGEDDRHLDFRALVAVETGTGGPARLVLTTVVQRHNALGRAYFAVVRPFHRRVVPAVLRRAVRAAPSSRIGVPLSA